MLGENLGLPIGLSVIFLIFLFFFGFYTPQTQKDEKKIIKYIGISGICIIFATYMLMSSERYAFCGIYIVFIIIVIFVIKYILKLEKKNNIDIVAKQSNYWDISLKDIHGFYEYRQKAKKKRVEIKVNSLSKKIYRKYSNTDKFIATNIFSDMKKIRLTKLNKVDEIRDIYLYNKIFSKIVEFCNDAEIEVDFEDILNKNNNIAEYFLIDCWCKFTKRYNIGTANLELFAENYTQNELIGALDNADMSCVKRHGAGLYYMYADFKGLIEYAVKEPEKAEEVLNEEDEDF